MIRHEEVFRGLWCVDSESGERVLVNLDTNQVILKSVDGKIMYPTDEQKTEGQT
jgi:hypothetical protein